jgi:hypothetical protein
MCSSQSFHKLANFLTGCLSNDIGTLYNMDDNWPTCPLGNTYLFKCFSPGRVVGNCNAESHTGRTVPFSCHRQLKCSLLPTYLSNIIIVRGRRVGGNERSSIVEGCCEEYPRTRFPYRCLKRMLFYGIRYQWVQGRVGGNPLEYGTRYHFISLGGIG